MIVCHCTGTTDRRIRQEVDSGARSCAEIGRRCSAGTICGGCTPIVECMVAGKSAMTPLRANAARTR